MFEALGERLQRVFKELRGEGSLTEFHLDRALREIRLSLLEADVALPVAKQFLDSVRQEAAGKSVATALSPAQEVLRIVRDRLAALLGGQSAELDLRGHPAHVMLVGLQGSGKTTTAGKLALYLKEKRGKHPFLVPCDLARPAAVTQLQTLGRALGVPVFDPAGSADPVAVAAAGAREGKLTGRDVILFDTAGRLHVDEALMAELSRVKREIAPHEILFVADAMTGQDAVRSASAFEGALGLTGVVMTKTDGDARGGGALSIVSATGRPIKFVGTGEKPGDFELFHPDRMASRILGMGDMLSLIEKIEGEIDGEEAARAAQRATGGEFTLEDLRDQLRQMRKMGPLSQMLDFLPRVGPFRQLAQAPAVEEKELVRVEAIVDSMTPEERRFPQIINGSRRKRIARGSGTRVEDVNRLLRQHAQMKKLFKSARSLGRGIGRADLRRMAMSRTRI